MSAKCDHEGMRRQGSSGAWTCLVCGAELGAAVDFARVFGRQLRAIDDANAALHAKALMARRSAFHPDPEEEL